MTQTTMSPGKKEGGRLDALDLQGRDRLPAIERRHAASGTRLAPFTERIGSALQTVIHEALVLDEIDAQLCGDDQQTGRLRDACQGLWQASTAISDALMSLDAANSGRHAD